VRWRARGPRWIGLAGLALALAAGAAAGGEPDELATPADDERAGEQALARVEAEMGFVADEALQHYVAAVGARVAAQAPPSPFTFTFHVVDQEVANAFAVPGGYVFVTAGLLALANSEDELANVLGHEITHVVKRHAARQEAVAEDMSPLTGGMYRALQLASYSREDEREADEGGQRMAAAAGYDPQAMTVFLSQLAQESRLEDAGASIPSFFDSHPSTPGREGDTALVASEIQWSRVPGIAPTPAAFLAKLDGLPLGGVPSEGVFQGNRFVQPAMGFSMLFPEDWSYQNTPEAVTATAPLRDAEVALASGSPGGDGDAESAALAFVRQAKAEGHFEVHRQERVRVGAAPAYRIEGEGRRDGEPVDLVVTFFPHRGSVLQIRGTAVGGSLGRYRGEIMSATLGFQPLDSADRTSLHSERLAVAHAERGENLAQLGDRTGNRWDPTRTAVMNGLDVDAVLEADRPVKIAASVSYAGRAGAGVSAPASGP
jgi:predicted Zn-dependent protease